MSNNSSYLAPSLPPRSSNTSPQSPKESHLFSVPSSSSSSNLSLSPSTSISTPSPSAHLILLLLFDPLFQSSPSPLLLELLAKAEPSQEDDSPIGNPLQSKPQSIDPISQLSFSEKSRRFRNALLRASSSPDLDLLYWLLDSRSPARNFLRRTDTDTDSDTDTGESQPQAPSNPRCFIGILSSQVQ